jgi:hypothetical protein
MCVGLAHRERLFRNRFSIKYTTVYQHTRSDLLPEFEQPRQYMELQVRAKWGDVGVEVVASALDPHV